jgi:hypothetical protein
MCEHMLEAGTAIESPPPVETVSWAVMVLLRAWMSSHTKLVDVLKFQLCPGSVGPPGGSPAPDVLSGGDGARVERVPKKPIDGWSEQFSWSEQFPGTEGLAAHIQKVLVVWPLCHRHEHNLLCLCRWCPIRDSRHRAGREQQQPQHRGAHPAKSQHSPLLTCLCFANILKTQEVESVSHVS